MNYLQYFELILLLAVICIEIVILIKMSKESKERSSLICSLQKTREVFGWESYLGEINRNIRTAAKSVFFVGKSMHPPDIDQAQKDILKTTRKVISQLDSYRGILGKSPENIRGGYLQRRAGVDIRFSRNLNYSDLSFTIVDKFVCIIGISEDDKKTRGYTVHSEILANILQRYFETDWENSMDFSDYLAEIVEQMRAQGRTIEKISEELKIPKSELSKYT